MKTTIPHSAFRIPHSTQGIVYLVGAGPGDPKLITVKGLEALQRADVVIYDHLVSPRLLEQCRPGAQIIYAGKEQGEHAKSQHQINRLLIRYAKAGKAVVRLKGGDPVLFGRGGEEALACRAAGVQAEFVPGVTSAIAAPAYAGIPVTHRLCASSVAIVTGHEDPGKPDTAIRWAQVATATDTLVILMGVGTLGTIAQRLIEHGRAKQTPCAAIEWGTWPQQRTVVGTLSTIAARCRQARLKPPAVIVVGEVVKLRKYLTWFERAPLFGKRIVVTRPAEKADQLADQLEALGAEVVRLPAIELAAVDANGLFHRAVDELPDTDWVFFTSPEGIGWFERLLKTARKDLRILHGCHLGAIGPKTAASIEQRGLHVDYLPTAYSQEGIVKGLAARRLRGQHAVIFSAEGSREVLEDGLRRLGMDVCRVPIYRTVVPETLARHVKQAFADRVDVVTATSSSCVEHLVRTMRSCGLSRRVKALRFASIGPVTSATIRRMGARVAIQAKVSTIEGLVDALSHRTASSAQTV